MSEKKDPLLPGTFVFSPSRPADIGPTNEEWQPSLVNEEGEEAPFDPNELTQRFEDAIDQDVRERSPICANPPPPLWYRLDSRAPNGSFVPRLPDEHPEQPPEPEAPGRAFALEPVSKRDIPEGD
ncbi:hypothetical protein KBA73_03720 [Patescibacteria group bacterium]|nr:hypothetical protein [Patescibacteria group bacterium]